MGLKKEILQIYKSINLTRLPDTIFMKLLVTLLVVAIVPMLLVVFLDYHASKMALTSAVYRALFSAASHSAEGLDAFMVSNLTAMGSEAKSAALIRFLESKGDTAARANALRLLKSLAEKDSQNITAYALYDSAGHMLVSSSQPKSGMDDNPEQEFFHGAMHTGLPYASALLYSAEDNNPYISFSAPVISAGGLRLGVIRAEYRADVLQKLIAKNNGIVGQNSFAIIFDENLLRIAHGANPANAGKTVVPLKPEKFAIMQALGRLPKGDILSISTDMPDYAEGLKKADSSEPFFMTKLRYTGDTPVAGAVTRMNTMPWLVAFFQPEDIFLAPVRSQRNRTLLLLFAVLAAVSLAAVLIARRLAKPMENLTETANRISDGDLAATARVSSSDEIGRLANAFNLMTAKLQRRENSLAEEKERLAVTLRSIGDGVITTDIHGNVVLLNKVAEELTGWKQKDAANLPLTHIFRIVNEKTRLACENPFELVMRTGGIIGLASNTVLISKDGKERIIADSGAPIRDNNSMIIGVVIVFRDVTEKERMETELLRAQKLNSVGVLAGGIAHDFNNILTAILGNISLAKIYAITGKCSDRLDEAEKAALRAKDLTQQLLTFSRGGAPIKKVASVSEVIEESAAFALRGSNVKLEFIAPEDLCFAEVDEGQISQVIHNMVLNAVQAMPAGGIMRIGLSNFEATDKHQKFLKAGRYLLITLSDTGTGIQSEYLDKIFDPYFTTKEYGSGLGLASCYSIITKHDGHIAVESEPGKGTTFMIYLPATDKTPVISEAGPRPLYQGKGRVLVVDDDELIRRVAGDLVRHLGYSVDFAICGEEALSQYHAAMNSDNPFDVVIMDITIPGGMGGAVAIKELLKMDPNAKAIVSSGYSNDPIMADYAAYGFCGVVVKPYIIDELSSTLEAAIRAHRS